MKIPTILLFLLNKNPLHPQEKQERKNKKEKSPIALTTEDNLHSYLKDYFKDSNFSSNLFSFST